MFAEVSNRSHAGKALAKFNLINYNYNLSKLPATFKLIEGIKTSNTALLDRLLHDELLFIAPNGEIVTKEADLASHRKGDMEVERLEARIEDVRIVEDNAIVAG